MNYEIIKDKEKLRYDLQFTYDRKLSDKDKCKVVTEKVSRTTVVCTR